MGRPSYTRTTRTYTYTPHYSSGGSSVHGYTGSGYNYGYYGNNGYHSYGGGGFGCICCIILCILCCRSNNQDDNNGYNGDYDNGGTVTETVVVESYNVPQNQGYGGPPPQNQGYGGQQPGQYPPPA